METFKKLQIVIFFDEVVRNIHKAPKLLVSSEILIRKYGAVVQQWVVMQKVVGLRLLGYIVIFILGTLRKTSKTVGKLSSESKKSGEKNFVTSSDNSLMCPT